MAPVNIPHPSTPSHSPALRAIEGRGTDDARWLESREVAAMPTCDIDTWPARYRRIWLVAPHPDDELLALGATLSRLAALGADLCIVSVTDGEASHPGSTEWPAARLGRERNAEMQRGLAALEIDTEVQRVGLPDGRVDAHRTDLLRVLIDQIDERDLLLTTCRFDGHPDHEACGEVTATAAELIGATCHEYPVWMWHWAAPGSTIVPWDRARRIEIDDTQRARKHRALMSFTSQIERDGPREAVLPPHVLARFLRPFEVVFT